MIKSLTMWDVMGKSREQLIDYIEGMQMVIDHYENKKTAMWHDLRKNPDNLPTSDGDYLCYLGHDEYSVLTYYHSRKDKYYGWVENKFWAYAGERREYYVDGVIAWFEIPRFEEDEEE